MLNAQEKNIIDRWIMSHCHNAEESSFKYCSFSFALSLLLFVGNQQCKSTYFNELLQVVTKSRHALLVLP